MDDPNSQPAPAEALEPKTPGVPPGEPAEETKAEEPVPEPKKVVIPEEIMESMKQLWNVFSKRSTQNVIKDQDLLDKVVDIKHLKTVMRALDFDFNPTELEIVRKQIDPNSEGFIRWSGLNVVMEDKLKEVDTYEDLIEEFKKLDKDSDGKIPAPEFKQYMKNMGQKFTDAQTEELMEEADAKGEGVVNMEDFGMKICPAKD